MHINFIALAILGILILLPATRALVLFVRQSRRINLHLAAEPHVRESIQRTPQHLVGDLLLLALMVALLAAAVALHIPPFE